MSGSDFPIEKTKYGDQYIIPGAEKRIRPAKKKQFYKLEGNQYCLPGTDPKLQKNRLPRKSIRKKPAGSRSEKVSTLDLFGSRAAY